MMNPVPVIFTPVAPSLNPWVGEIDSTEKDSDGPDGESQPGVMTNASARLAMTTRAKDLLRI
jgi:hypothetical protein